MHRLPRVLLVPLLFIACHGDGESESPPPDDTSSATSAVTRPPLTVPTNTILADTSGVLSPEGEGSVSVDDRGQAHEHIPIWVPPGRAGMQPELSLDYSSGAGNSIVGIGWALSGLSRITRCPSLRKNGQIAPPIVWSSNDTWCLDGEPLVPNNGLYRKFHDDASVAIRPTSAAGESQSWQLYTKDGRILTFGGTVDSKLMASNVAGGPMIMSYALSRVQDRAGNFMTFTYESPAGGGGDIRPLRIDYTGSSSDPTTHRSLTFTYEARPDVDQREFAAQYFTYPARLHSIEMHAPNSANKDPLRSLTLGYKPSDTTGRSLLNNIAECAGGARTSLPVSGSVPLCRQQTLSYTPGVALGAIGAYNGGQVTDSDNAPIADIAKTGPQGVPPNVHLLDVDGDGRDDVLYEATDGTYHLRLSMGSVFGRAILTGIPVVTADNLPQVQAGPSAPLVVDFNNDGHADVIVNQGETFPYYRPQVRLYLATYTNNSWTLGGPGQQLFLPAPIYSDAQVADLNGDARPDLVMSAGSKAFYTLNTNGTVTGLSAVAPLPLQDNADYFDSLTNYYLDLNNDGVTDLMTRRWADDACKTQRIGYSNGVLTCDCDKMKFGAFNIDPHLYAGSQATQSTPVSLNYCKLEDLGDDLPSRPTYDHLFGDFNGDGIADVIETFTPQDAAGDTLPMQLALLLGRGNQTFMAAPGGAFTIANPDVAFETMDADGDGKTDLIARGYNAANPTLPYTVWSFKNQHWQPATVLNAEAETDNASVFATGDVDGDGQSDFVALDGNGYLALYTRNPGARADLLQTTTGEFTRTTTLKYQPYRIASDEDRSDCQLPLTCTTRGGFVVNEIDTDNGIGGTNAQLHSFSGGRSDTQGWGFLGFKKHTITDEVTGAKTVRTFDFREFFTGATPFFPLLGKPTDVRTTIPYQNGAQNVIRTTITGTSYIVQGAGPFMALPNVVESVTTDSNDGSPIASSNIQRGFDSFGDVTSEQTYYPLADESRATTTTYLDDTNNWLIGRPTYVSTTSTVNMSNGGTSQTRETAYAYDALGQLAVEIDNPGAANGSSYDPLPTQTDRVQTLYTRYTRNPNGLPTLVEKLDNLSSPTQRRPTKYDYDTLEGMFVIQTTDPMSLVTQAAYEPGLGVIAAQTDAAGVLTTFQYDTFGRIRFDHPAAGGGRTVAYHAGGTIDDHRSGGYKTTTTLDSLRRAVATAATGRLDGKTMYTETTFDPLGRVHTVSRPHFIGVSPATTTTTYDTLGRVTKVVGADGSVQTTSYVGLQATSTNADGNMSMVTNDALGRPVTSVQATATGPSGLSGHVTTTTLAYGPFGTLISSTDTLGNLVSSTYDRLGRLRWKKDSDSRATAHFYNVFGEVSDEFRGSSIIPVVFGGKLSWLVNGGIDTQMTYDDDGRVLTKSASDVTQTFTYDTVMAGKLSNVAITDGPTIAYTYDAFGNVKTKKWSGPRGAIGYAYTYDQYNRLATTTYPVLSNGTKSLVVRNTYSGGDVGGQLTKVDDVTTSTTANYWTLTSTDASEQFPVANLSNGVQSTFGEDSSHPGWLKTILAKKGTATVQSLRYTREGGGRVQKREDISDPAHPITETFGYDGLERLTSWSWNGAAGARGASYVYDDIGNLRQRNITAGPGTSVTYTPGVYPFGPHQVASDSLGTTYQYDEQGDEVSGPGRTFIWSPFARPTSVTASTGTYTMTYDADLARFSRTDPAGHTRYSYGGLFDEFTDAAGKHDVMTITAGGKPVGEKEITNNAASSTTTNTLLTDALGSIDTIVTATRHDASKYDPFGTRVTVTDPTVRITTAPHDLRAGFTGHDHDDDINLIDMIGRVYDPQQQRFLSVDPPAPDPVDSQAYNPYAYVRNNPLNATDPTGYLEITMSGLPWKVTDQDIYTEPQSTGRAFMYGSTFDVVQGADGTAGTGNDVANDIVNIPGVKVAGDVWAAKPEVEEEKIEVDPTAAKVVEGADASRGVLKELFELNEPALKLNGLDEGFMGRLKIGGYVLAAMNGWNMAAERGDDGWGRAIAAATSVGAVALPSPDALIGGGVTLLDMASGGRFHGGLEQISGATAGSWGPQAIQLGVQAVRTLGWGTVKEGASLEDKALYGAYGSVWRNYSVAGQWMAGNGNRIMDEAPTGKLGAPAKLGDAFGDWLGKTLPCGWCTR